MSVNYQGMIVPSRGEVQGKCTRCERRYIWPNARMKLTGAFCPRCGNKLERTTYTVRLQVDQIFRPADHAEAKTIAALYDAATEPRPAAVLMGGFPEGAKLYPSAPDPWVTWPDIALETLGPRPSTSEPSTSEPSTSEPSTSEPSTPEPSTPEPYPSPALPRPAGEGFPEGRATEIPVLMIMIPVEGIVSLATLEASIRSARHSLSIYMGKAERIQKHRDPDLFMADHWLGRAILIVQALKKRRWNEAGEM